MPDDCLACETPIGASAAHCDRCGFPTALTAAAVIGLGRAGFPEAEPAAAPAGPTVTTMATPPAPSPEELAIAHFARELRHALDLIRELAGESSDIVGELRQAALLQVEGQTSDSLAALRGAQVRASARVSELFEHRLRELEDRERALLRLGIGPDVLQGTSRLRAEFAESPIPVVVEHLAEADRRLSRTESEWQEFRGLLREIDQLHAAAAKVGHPIPDAEERLAALQARMGPEGVPTSEVRGLLGRAGELLQSYQERLAPHLQAELDRHAQHLARYHPEHPPSRRARQVHAEANRHLRSGRLGEASVRITELREALNELMRSPAADAPSGTVASPTPAVALPILLRTAREIAVRVKSLPAESPLAAEAGQQIRRATELLRTQQLEAAGRTLTELMATLDRAAAEEAPSR